MNFHDINPFIRYAGQMYHISQTNWVSVKDCRLFYIVSGKADIFIENQHYELVPDSLFYCCGGNKYNIESSGVMLYCLNFDLTQDDNTHTSIYPRNSIEETSALSFTPFCIIEDSNYINAHLFIKNGAGYVKDITTILDEYATRMIFFRERASSILKNLLALMHRHSLAPTNHATIAVTKTIAYIKAHYNEPLNNKSLSDITGYHEYHLNRLFLKHTNTSIHQYIIAIRIDEAKKLLLNTDFSIALIAEKIGFNSNTHFSNYFKQIVGFSPLEFRKQFKNQM